MISLKDTLKIIIKVFIGALITLCIIFSSSFGLTFLAEQFIDGYIDTTPFLLHYPLLTIFLLGIYLVFWKKQYSLTIGLFLGFILFMLLMAFLFEVLAGPATL
ncbi:MAG: hypothetical protein HYS02_02135 [Candidatus Staskawiczbacteria bacterium]|nr:hypothetical protein [Candidatus Staskawiczbacteria bacterium]